VFDFHGQFDHRWCASHPWALIDAGRREELPAHWPVAVIAPAFLGEDTGRCPVLLNLQALATDEQSSIYEQLATQVHEREDTLVSLLLSSEAQPASLIAHLAHRLAIRMAGDTVPKQLRYFDPGTFLQLPHHFGGAGMVWLLGPVESVLVPWAGQWTRVARPAGVAAQSSLRTTQMAALSRIGAVNRAALQMGSPASPAAWIERCRRINVHVQRGLEVRALSHVEDLAAFARHAMAHHPAFDSHPLLTQLFDQLRIAQPEDELDYRELSARLGPDDWARVVHELPAVNEERFAP
jgi:hypothetical protein